MIFSYKYISQRLTILCTNVKIKLKSYQRDKSWLINGVYSLSLIMYRLQEYIFLTYFIK
jgi:hypothetical protein